VTFKPAQKKTLRVILDSNALFVPLQFKIDIFSELERLLKGHFELILLSAVKRELETLAEKGSPKMRKNALYALKLAEKCRYLRVNDSASASTDDIIIKVAKEQSFFVFTNDKRLRKKLRNISVPVVYLRQKSHLEIDGMM
jgi:rRNA-processing protein FCF1